MKKEYRTAIERSKKQIIREGQKAQPRKSREAVVDNTRSVEAAARTKMLRSDYRSIENQAEKERNARRYQSKADIEKRVRSQVKLGTVAKGQVQKTVDRRFKATQGRKAKFDSALKARVITQKDDARTRMQSTTRAQLGVRTATVLVTFRISNDIRSVTLTFATVGDINADARAALRSYMHAGDDEGNAPPILSVTELK